MSNPRSTLVWLRLPTSGPWTQFTSATEAARFLNNEKGITIYRTQVTRATEKQKARDRWEFPDTHREETRPLSESAPTCLKATTLASFFAPASTSCACCNENSYQAGYNLPYGACSPQFTMSRSTMVKSRMLQEMPN